MKRSLSLLPLALVMFGCSGEGNTGQPNRNFSWLEGGTEVSLWDEVPWANHATPQFASKPDGSMGAVKISGAPVFPPIGQNAPDPGSHPVDCSALDGIELAPYYDSFEPTPAFIQANGTRAWGVATAWSSYDDGSDNSFRTPGDVSWYPDLGGSYIGGGNTPFTYDRATSPWGLAADRQTGERPLCDGGPNDWVLHYRGGRFNYYGGGMAHPFSPPPDPAFTYCPQVKQADGSVVDSDLCPANRDVFPASPTNSPRPGYWDGSSYDGVVFWARRGPDAATGLLVALQDKYTSDDLARENEKFCKRIKVCISNCVNGFSCTGDGMGTNRCMPEGYVIDPSMNPALAQFLFPPCKAPDRDDTCKPPAFYLDPDFNDTQCNAFAFTGNDEGYWCSSPDKPVAPYAERCGDAFVTAISLSTDWKLYKLPFDSFRQVGFGKPAPSFDLKTLYSIAFQFTVGYADVYVDNVSFYRNK